MADPIAELDRLLVEDPEHPDIDTAMVVAGDLLQHQGQIRGELIALELLLRAAPPGHEHEAIADTLESWVAGHDARLFGSLHALRHLRGAIRYAFHGGRINEFFLDTRRLRPDPRLSLGPDEFVQLLLGSPLIKHAQRLQIRAKQPETVVRLMAELQTQAKSITLPTEQLVISTTTRPIGHRAALSQPTKAIELLRKVMPKLWFVTESSLLVSLIDPASSDEASAADLHALRGQPMSRDLRVLIGRGLTSGRREPTTVACERIAEHGESARVFLPALRMLLRPRVSHAAAWIVPMLPMFGPWVRELRPQLQRITGSATTYAVEVRRAAGHALRHLG